MTPKSMSNASSLTFVTIDLPCIENDFRHLFSFKITIETGPVSGVASGHSLMGFNQKTVRVAVKQNLDHLLDMAGRFTLLPQFPPGAGEKVCKTRTNRFFNGLDECRGAAPDTRYGRSSFLEPQSAGAVA